MCGICGYRSEKPVNIGRMISILSHRGPDGEGIFKSRDVGLGHRRLAIIDLVTGNQPMISADQQRVIVFNGEIYNFIELRKSLQQQGAVFKTSSDTEVLLHLYEIYGTDLLKFLNGEFAFVIYDQRKDILFGARDRLGIKPFYYTINDSGFFFASEMKALFESGHITPIVNRMAVDLYFAYRYIPGENTIYKNIYKLSPGHAFIQSGRDNPKIWRYWDLPQEEEPIGLDEALGRFEEIFIESLRYRLISDVPLGVFLSGGVDSTTLVAGMSQLNHKPIRTFTAGFQMPLDETDEASRIAQVYECEHCSLTISPDSLALLSKIIWHMDEPFGDSILVPTFCLSQEAARHVKVVLTGEGADEGQFGYIHHAALQKGFLLARRVPSAFMNFIRAGVLHLPVSFLDIFFKYPMSMGVEGRHRLNQLMGLFPHPGQAYQHFCSLFTEEERQRLYGPDLKSALQEAKETYHDPVARSLNASADPLRDIYIHEIKHWLPDNILNKQDRMTMAYSLEGRVPFLDHRLIEFEARLPRTLKLNNGRGKYLLRSFYSKKFLRRAGIIKNKKAFMMPLDGFYHKIYKELVNRYLNDSNIASGLFDKIEVQSIINSADGSPLLGHKKVMALIMFHVWLEVFKPEWS